MRRRALLAALCAPFVLRLPLVGVGPSNVVLGDSVAEGYPLWRNPIDAGLPGYLSPGPGGDPTAQISYHLALLAGGRWVNAGRASDTAAKVLARFSDHAAPHLGPRSWLVLHVGVNDLVLGVPEEEHAAALEAIRERTASLGARLVLVGVGPGDSLTAEQCRAAAAWNARRASWAAAVGVVFVDRSPQGVERPGGDPRNRWDLAPPDSHDGLHLSPAGAAHLAALVAASLTG